MRALAALVAISVLLFATPASSSSPPVRPRVTLISDSVAAAIAFDTGAKAILADGVDLFLEPGQARLLGGENPPGAIAPVTTVQLIQQLGRELGPTVIVSVGDNDFSDTYAQHLEEALDDMHAAGVQHVLWVTLHYTDAHAGFRTMNDAIATAATQHPELTVVDWNAYATPHHEWFQPDGVHLAGDGPRALARLLHASLVKLGVPVSPGT